MLFVTTYQTQFLAASFLKVSACTTPSALTNFKCIFILKSRYKTHSMDNSKRDHRQHWKLKDHWGKHKNEEKHRQESPRKFMQKLDACHHCPGQRGGSTTLLHRHRLGGHGRKRAFELVTGEAEIEGKKLRIKQCKLARPELNGNCERAKNVQLV